MNKREKKMKKDNLRHVSALHVLSYIIKVVLCFTVDELG